MNQPFDHEALTRDVRARFAEAAHAGRDHDETPSAATAGRLVDVPRTMTGRPITAFADRCGGTGCC